MSLLESVHTQRKACVNQPQNHHESAEIDVKAARAESRRPHGDFAAVCFVTAGRPATAAFVLAPSLTPNCRPNSCERCLGSADRSAAVTFQCLWTTIGESARSRARSCLVVRQIGSQRSWLAVGAGARGQAGAVQWRAAQRREAATADLLLCTRGRRRRALCERGGVGLPDSAPRGDLAEFDCGGAWKGEQVQVQTERCGAGAANDGVVNTVGTAVEGSVCRLTEVCENRVGLGLAADTGRTWGKVSLTSV